MDTNESAQAIAEESAEDKLSRMEAEQSAELASTEAKSPDTSEAQEAGDRPPAAAEAVTDPKTDPKTGTPSAADKEIETAKTEAEKEGKELKLDDKGQPARDAQGKFIKQAKPVVEPAVTLTPDEHKKFSAYLKQTQSKFGADLGKRLVRWDAIKEAEAKLAKDREGIQGEINKRIQAFNADVARFQAEKAQASPTPEKYEAFADKQSALADHKELEAVKAEEAGELDKAEALRDEAKFARRDAQSAKASAEHLRKNPPVSLEKQKEQFTTHQREWVVKAVQDFPDYGKKGSDLQSGTAEVFKQITTAHPEAARMPGLVYYCVRIAAAEAAAARVPALEKELGELKPKLTELEALTNPTLPGGVPRKQAAKTFEKMDSDAQFAELRREAGSGMV